ncbi:MAG: protein-L-isoaspartate(D-aspartate) O-methyltransferase, partial [Clostridiaceae bacterium]|nr:protein-L-isoaspartate(D-aspartate) O-methyltransferase [Clostridiaceae bacterium]
AGAGKIPNSLIEQLAPEGRMLVPVGKRYMQELLLIEKDSKGRIIETCLGDVAFVELKGDYGWEN